MSPALRSRLVALAVLVGVAAAWQAVPWVRSLLPQQLDLEVMADPPGFRRLGGGATSGGFDPFVGLGGRDAPTGPGIDPDSLRADLCGALFGAPPAPGTVPIAAFSDYYCPFCRVLTRRLAAMESQPGSTVRVTWHEWPLLGANSMLAARASLAADRQGAYAAFQAALSRGGFVATPAFLADVAGRAGIDPARLLADMEHPAITESIARTTALSRLFGFPGTPSLVVGRTVVVGEIDEPTLRALIDRERADGALPFCQAG
jgi:protein-disulfide isomerase